MQGNQQQLLLVKNDADKILFEIEVGMWFCVTISNLWTELGKYCENMKVG